MNIDLGVSTGKKSKVRFGVLSTEEMAFEAEMPAIPKEHSGPCF